MSKSNYDMRLRKLRQEFRAAKQRLEEREKREPKPESEKRKKRRYRQRRAAIPQDRTCPECNEVKINSRQWVVTEAFAVCLSCYRDLNYATERVLVISEMPEKFLREIGIEYMTKGGTWKTAKGNRADVIAEIKAAERYVIR